jgi:serine/threonine-protein kinase
VRLTGPADQLYFEPTGGTVIGQTLSHYKITDKLGQGGMGEVYSAQDSQLGRAVALKVLPEAFTSDPERLARFDREARLLAALDHPNIAAIYGVEEHNGTRFLVMQLVDGDTLADRIGRGPVPVEEALRFARGIAEALEAAHARGIIHRDLKPANVKVDGKGQIRVLDFGLAKALEGDPGDPDSHTELTKSPTLTAQMTGAGALLGTAAYMSPEQARGETADRRADLWALGVVLWEMLTGSRLFPGKTVTDTLAGVLRDEPDWESLPSETPASVRRLLRRCLERDPQARLADASTARLELEDALAGRDEDRDATHATLVATPGWRRALPWALFGTAAAALIATLLLSRPAAEPPARPVRLEAVVSEVPLWVPLGSSVVMSPDGSQMAFVVEDSSGIRTLYLRSLEQLTPVAIASGPSGRTPYHPFFSPDGTWLGFVTPNELKKVPVTGGTPIALCPVDRGRGATWAADDTIVFAPSGSSGLMQVPASGGQPRPLTTLDDARGEFSHRWPHAVPDGTAVVFTIGTEGITTADDATIAVVSLASGERKDLYVGGYYGQVTPSGHLVFIRDATLFAVPFDLDRLEVVGSPAPVVQGITTEPGPGGAQFSFAENGTLVYVSGEVEVPQYPVVWVDRDGGVSKLWEAKASYASPAVSPDGRRLALSVLRDSNWDVWVYDLEREVSTRLTFHDGYDADQIWSPDGRYLFYTSDQDGVQRPYRKRADGSGEAERLSDTEAPFYPLSATPDGKILIGETTGDGIDIAVLDVESGSELEPFLATSFDERDPMFSPDGRWVAYASDESGVAEVYVRPFPSAGGRWQVSDGGGRFPTWSADGQELFYRTENGIMVASVETDGDSFRVGKAGQLFEGDFRGGMTGISVFGYIFRDFDVAPDGRHFVMFPDDEDRVSKTHVTVVFNWFDELRRTLPTN